MNAIMVPSTDGIFRSLALTETCAVRLWRLRNSARSYLRRSPGWSRGRVVDVADLVDAERIDHALSANGHDEQAVLLAMRKAHTTADERAFALLTLPRAMRAAERLFVAGLTTAIDSGALTDFGERVALLLSGGSR